MGTGGTLLSGTSTDGAKSISLLLFTQGNTASAIKFSGPANDPAPAELVTELAQKQDAAIQAALGA